LFIALYYRGWYNERTGVLYTEVAYTYWEADDGWFVGYLNDYPDHLTQGHDLAELEEMLADVYQIRQDEEKRLALCNN
jgi:hypothetical protein